MPRNSSGVMSRPAGTTAVPNTTIASAAYNTAMDDLVADANAARPVTAGGTGATAGSAALSNLGVTDYAKTLLDDANAAAALVTLGAVPASDTQVQTVTSAVSAIDFTVPAGSAFELTATDVICSVNGGLGVRISLDGASFASASTDYLYTTTLQRNDVLTPLSENGAACALTGLVVPTATLCINVRALFSPGGATARPTCVSQASYPTTGPVLGQATASSQLIPPGRAQKIRLLMTVGNIVSGIFTLRKIA